MSRLGAPSTVDETVGRGASFMANTPATTPEPAPKHTESPAAWPLIVADLDRGGLIDPSLPAEVRRRLSDAASARDQFGRAKYGTPLQVENGRDAATDAYQEALDLCAYTRQKAEQTGLWFWHELARESVRLAAAVLRQMRLEAEGEG
jgi:hypothetical protein